MSTSHMLGAAIIVETGLYIMVREWKLARTATRD